MKWTQQTTVFEPAPPWSRIHGSLLHRLSNWRLKRAQQTTDFVSAPPWSRIHGSVLHRLSNWRLKRAQQTTDFVSAQPWSRIHGSVLHRLSNWRLERAQQTAIIRLRTGHCGLSAHLKRTGISDTSLCECGQADQNPRPHPSVLPNIYRETSANMAAWCLSVDQAVGLGRRPLLDVSFCGIDRTEDLTFT